MQRIVFLDDPVKRLTRLAITRCLKACLRSFSWTSTEVFLSRARALINLLPKFSRSLLAFFLSLLYAVWAAFLLPSMVCEVSLNAVIIPVRRMSLRIFFVLALVPLRFRCSNSHISMAPRAFFYVIGEGNCAHT